MTPRCPFDERTRDRVAVAHGEIVPCRRLYISTEAERRGLDRAHDDTQFEVDTITIHRSDVTIIDRIVASIAHQVLCINSSVSVVHILVARRQTEIDSIAEVGAEVEVIITDVTIVFTVDLVVGSRVVIDLAAIHFESLHVEVVEARIRSVVAVKGTVAQLLIRQFVG